MGLRDVVDGRLLGATTGGKLATFFASRVAIQSRASTLDAHGQPSGAWSDVAGLTGLACSVGLPRGGERRTGDMVPLHEEAEILLASYQAAITPKMRAVVTGGLTYDILSVEHDPLGKLTRLVAQRVTL